MLNSVYLPKSLIATLGHLFSDNRTWIFCSGGSNESAIGKCRFEPESRIIPYTDHSARQYVARRMSGSDAATEFLDSGRYGPFLTIAHRPRNKRVVFEPALGSLSTGDNVLGAKSD